jgi:hypothetical protein
MDQNSDLLTPSLSADHGRSAAIYSLRTGFLTAFFGGPVGGATIALLNSYRLGRLAVDWPIALLAIAVSAAMDWSITHGVWRWLDASLGRGSVSLAVRLVDVAFFAVVYALHRTYYKGMAVLGITSPNGLAVGVGAIIVGVLADAALTRVLAP